MGYRWWYLQKITAPLNNLEATAWKQLKFSFIGNKKYEKTLVLSKASVAVVNEDISVDPGEIGFTKVKYRI
jgi:UDP-3-O-[3-hydroxymyristoyl] glucosamine N-acyltransferase